MAENKKDSFTFSDKIKNSKPAFNPFSKRASSKIGNNGKPKKTIFERTRRDAPFFIAAAVALLMLPFLYKYSGSVAEEPFVAPGTEDSVFEPERFGFNPTSEDPNGQISQLSGRDPLSLIKGWGDPAASSAGNMDEDFVNDRDGLGGGYDSPVQDSPRSSYRQSVPAQTRASFKRQTTPIKELGGASMNLRGGGGNYGRFGGSNLKSAAKQDSSGGPRQGVKPVSLQPLRAAGNPSRSYFGQGPAAQARASRDAMGKSNAQQALNDAMFRPIGPGHAGGNPMTGDFAPGGGAGKWDNKMDYKGITPWWWDMMKDREQKKWEWKYFLWRKNLVEPLIKALAEVAATFGKGLACCLLTGNDDCGMDSMWGKSAGSGDPAKCGELTEEDWNSGEYKAKWGEFNKPHCKTFLASLDKDSSAAQKGWQDSTKSATNMNFFQVRGSCMGATVKGSIKGETKLADYYACQGLDSTHSFKLQAGGDASGWHLYHAVVAKNYNPYNPSAPLCGSSDTNWNKHSASAHVDQATGKRGGAAVGRKTSSHLDDELKPEEVAHYCVIYVAEGDVFHWDTFKRETTKWLKELKTKMHARAALDENQAFNALHLAFVEGYAFKDAFSKKTSSQGFTQETTDASGNTIEVDIERPLVGGKYPQFKVKMPIGEMPVLYQDFENKYVLNKDNDPKPGKNYKYKPRVFTNSMVPEGREQTNPNGKPNAVRMNCKFAGFSIKADPIESLDKFTAVLTHMPAVHGPEAQNIQVTVDFLETGLNNIPTTRSSTTTASTIPVAGIMYFAADLSGLTPADRTKLSDQAKKGLTAHWVARYGQKISSDDATYHGEEVIPDPVQPEPPCRKGQTLDSQTPCIFYQCKDDESGWDYEHPQVKNTPECRNNSCEPGATMDLAGTKMSADGRACYYLKCGAEHVWESTVYKYTDRPGCEPEPAGCEPGQKLDLTNTARKADDGSACFYLECTQQRQWGTDVHRYSEKPGCQDAPPPTVTKTPVHFVQDFTNVSKDPAKVKDGTWRQTPQGTWSSCKIDLSNGAGLVGWDSDIAHVYNEAKLAYNNANTETELVDEYTESNRGTAATLFDALMLYPSSSVPKNAVCMLGKTIGAGSVDTTLTIETSHNSNMFGAFAAFIGEDASFFPTSRYIGTDGEAYCNQQFIGCGANSGDNSTCRAGVAKKYHWGHYNVSEWNGGNNTADTPEAMRHIDTDPWKDSSGYILRELNQRVSYWNRGDSFSRGTGNDSVEDANRRLYWNKYGRFFQKQEGCGLDGTMSKAAAIRYIEVLCNSGTNIKPTNTDWLSCGKQTSRGTSSSSPI